MSDKPAFPLEKAKASDGSDYYPAEHLGLMRRELFAMSAMQGMLSNPNIMDNAEKRAIAAVVMADALIKALEVGGE